VALDASLTRVLGLAPRGRRRGEKADVSSYSPLGLVGERTGLTVLMSFSERGKSRRAHVSELCRSQGGGGARTMVWK
jgi:hypothetical protein